MKKINNNYKKNLKKQNKLTISTNPKNKFNFKIGNVLLKKKPLIIE